MSSKALDLEEKLRGTDGVGTRFGNEGRENDGSEPSLIFRELEKFAPSREWLAGDEEVDERLQLGSFQGANSSTDFRLERHIGPTAIRYAQRERAAVDDLLTGLDRPQPSRVTSQSSTVSSLEPLSEAFEVPTLLSPAIKFVPLPEKPEARRRSHIYFKRVAESELNNDFRASGSLSPKPKATNRRRAKSDTPLVLSPLSDEARILQKSCSPLYAPGSSGSPKPSSQIWSAFSAQKSMPQASPLIADVNVSKSRLLITKTHCFYPEESSLIPFSSCLLGFQLVFHPSDPKARIKHSQIKFSTHPPCGESFINKPIIKAIYPTQGVIHKTGEGTFVQRRDENSIGIGLGVDPYGRMILSHSQSKTQERFTSPYLLGSGIETNKLLITLNEDSTSHLGVPPSLAFAILLYLPSKTTKSFEADLTIETSVGGEIGASLRKMWASPKVWRLMYDGQTELGCLKIQRNLEKGLDIEEEEDLA
ncbi:hypothetical protein PPACK8108_LOCUS2058 [Phakopsora pachyrhizi]|uniref:Uncharacterized protein n=1 Tax=Phakopsora pachyrhizi TaxID=170000 RepID=A0AAV0AJC2_PHAPC|nr:hypothetical protein PPACK8108_LOCUS2058 [Phakopsora pachyrhizi]